MQKPEPPKHKWTAESTAQRYGADTKGSRRLPFKSFNKTALVLILENYNKATKQMLKERTDKQICSDLLYLW